MYFDRGNFYDFTSLVRELDIPGEIYERKTYPFEFSTVEMPYETYSGTNVQLRYVLKVTINRGYAGSIAEYQERNSNLPWLNPRSMNHYTMNKGINIIYFQIKAWFYPLLCRTLSRANKVQNCAPPPSINNSIKMEVRIEDSLHIEFEYKKKSTGSGPSTHVETETLAKFQLMDGAPVRGESIPIRLFLSPYEPTPTYQNVNNKFRMKYYFNLVLVDEEDHRYFKQQEVTMYRLAETT